MRNGCPSIFTLLGVAVLALVLAACDGGEASTTRDSFYAEVAVDAEPQADDPLARIDAGQQSSVIRWWYASDPQRWRWEFETRGGNIDDGTRVVVFDGESVWTYDNRSRTYQQEPAMELPAGMVLSPTFSAPVGPANAADLEAFMELWGGREGTEARLGGEDTVLGRPVQIVEIRPAWRSSSGSSSAPGPGQTPVPEENVETSGGVIRVAVDTERMLVMRWEVDGEGGGQSYRAEIVALEEEPSIEASVFEFTPPEGATQVQNSGGSCSGSGGTAGGSSVSFPPGFPGPGYVPAGFTSRGTGSEGGAGCEIAAVWALLEDDAGGYLFIKQRARPALPDSVLAWSPVELDRGDGYHDSRDGLERLAWHQDGVAVLLESDTLPLEELVLVANSFD